MKIAIILCAFFAFSNAAPLSGPFPAALSYGAWPAPAYHASWPAAVSYGAWPSSGYYTATKSVNIATPQHVTMTYASIPTMFAPATPAMAGSQYHAQDSIGQYSYGYANADGQAKVENRAHDGTILGKFSYMDPNGRQIETRYRAGSNGFEVEGEHLPQAPEVPELPEHVAEAYEKAREDFEEAKNRKGPSAPEAQSAEHQQIAPMSLAPSARFYSAQAAYPLPAAFVKSAYSNWN